MSKKYEALQNVEKSHVVSGDAWVGLRRGGQNSRVDTWSMVSIQQRGMYIDFQNSLSKKIFIPQLNSNPV